MLFIIGWLAIAPLVSSSLSTLFILENETWFLGFSFLEWTLFFCVTAFTMAFALTPTTYIAIVTGYFLGFQGAVAIVISYQCASVAGYFLSKRLNHGFTESLIEAYPNAKRVLSNVGKNDFYVAILSRLSPALPFAMMNVVLAVAKVRFASFFFGGLVGMLPRTLFFIWVGSQAAYLKTAISQKEGLGWVIGLTVLVFGAFYFMLKPTHRKIL